MTCKFLREISTEKTVCPLCDTTLLLIGGIGQCPKCFKVWQRCIDC